MVPPPFSPEHSDTSYGDAADRARYGHTFCSLFAGQKYRFVEGHIGDIFHQLLPSILTLLLNRKAKANAPPSHPPSPTTNMDKYYRPKNAEESRVSYTKFRLPHIKPTLP